MEVTMDAEPHPDITVAVACCLFAPARTAVDAHQCLAGAVPQSLSARYAAAYCLTDQHTACRRFTNRMQADGSAMTRGRQAVTEATDVPAGSLPIRREAGPADAAQVAAQAQRLTEWLDRAYDEQIADLEQRLAAAQRERDALEARIHALEEGETRHDDD